MSKFLSLLIGVILLCCAAVAQDNSSVTEPPSSSNVTASPEVTEPPPSNDSVNVTTAAPVNEETTEPAPEERQPCSLPEDLAGDWLSTLWDDVSISNTTITLGFGMGGQSLQELECYESSNDQYVFRSSEPFTIHGLDLYYYTCMKLQKRNQDNFHVIIQTERTEDSNNEPIKGVMSAEETDVFNNYCNSQNTIQGNLLRKGREQEGVLGCPESFRGVFNLTYTNNNTQTRCPGGAILTSCDQPKSLVMNYTTCSETASQDYQDTHTYMCVAQSQDQLLLYRNGTLDYAPFSCLQVISTEGEGVNATLEVKHAERGCFDTWKHTANQVSSIEFFSLAQLDNCTMNMPNVTPSTDDVDNTTDSSGNNTNGTSNGPEDAGTSVTSNGVLITALAAIIVLLLTDQFQ